MYLRYYSKTTPRVTVVADFLPGGESPVAIARCSNRDQFNRKLGRAIAEGRLAKDKTFCSRKFESPRDFVRYAEELSKVVSRQCEAVVREVRQNGHSIEYIVDVVRGRLTTLRSVTIIREGVGCGEFIIGTMRQGW